MNDWVVIVDDETTSLNTGRNLLMEQGVRVSCLKSGPALLKFMKKNEPDLVLLDVMMPEMDGFETLAALRKLEKEVGRLHTPVIFLTGESDAVVEQRGLEAGAADFVHKPFDQSVLLSRIKNTIENSKTIVSLKEEASVDKLTGFLNKGAGMERIRELCYTKTGILMVFDLDSFKLINDLYGHQMGDAVLTVFADLVRTHIREGDEISRIGGDEFMGFFGAISDEVSVKSLIERLNEQLVLRVREMIGEDFDVPIGISAGAVSVPNYGRELELLFGFADSSLYHVKQNGKHGCEMYGAGTESELSDNLEKELARVTQIVEERGRSVGALVLGQEAFASIYHFIRRSNQRNGSVATKMLIVLRAREEDGNALMTAAATQLGMILQNTLRRNDMVLHNRNYEFFVVLPELSPEAVGIVTERIHLEWENTDYNHKIRIETVAGRVYPDGDE